MAVLARMICGDEQDAFTGWRRYCSRMARPGVCKAIKRKFNRRVRAEGRRELRAA